MIRQAPRLLVIDPKTGYVGRFIGRKCVNIVHTDAPQLLGRLTEALEMFRIHGPLGQPTPPRVA